MKDIRNELTERLIAVKDERDKLQKRLQHLSDKEETLRTLLEEEELHFGNKQLSLSGIATFRGERHTPLASSLLDALADGQPRDVRQLAALVRTQGYDFGAKNPGRVVHFALVGLKQAKTVESIGPGVWRKVQTQKRDQESPNQLPKPGNK